MTLKDVIDAACDAVSIDRLDSIYGNDDPSANSMRALAQQAGDEIVRRADWQGLLVSAVLAGSGATLPGDFMRVAPGGGLRTSTGMAIRPVTNSGQWAAISAAPSLQAFYFLAGGVVRIAPVPAGSNAALDYLSANWVIGDNGVRKAALSADDDGFVFPGRLIAKNVIWRWRRLKGLAYDDHLAEFEADLVQDISADRGVA